MRVWIVNPFDNLPLEGNRPQRYWLLARAFARAGHDVTLWTSDFSHAHKAKRRLTQPQTRDFSLVLVETPAYPRNICFRRIHSHRVFARRWRKLAERETAPDVLIVSMPPLALGRAALAYCRACAGARPFLVVDVQDAWPETFERVVPRWTLAPLRRVAQTIYRGADAVVGVAARYVDLARAYGATSPMRIFRLGIDRRLGREPRTEGRGAMSKLVYAGNMGASYDLATVIAAVKGMAGVTLDLAGRGPDEARLRRLASDCGWIRFHGYLGETDLRALLASCDAAVVPMFDAACVGVPGKLADYTAAGLPVLNTLHGETERLLADYGAGVTYAAGDVAAFRAAVANLRAADAAALRQGAWRLSAEFDAEKVYGDYVAWVVGNGNVL